MIPSQDVVYFRRAPHKRFPTPHIVLWTGLKWSLEQALSEHLFVIYKTFTIKM